MSHRSYCGTNINKALSSHVISLLIMFFTHLFSIYKMQYEMFGYPSHKFSDLVLLGFFFFFGWFYVPYFLNSVDEGLKE